MNFRDFFKKATDIEEGPFLYQEKMATEKDFPSMLEVPTGMGKTATAILCWIWRRRYNKPEIRIKTPRRLVYCLPMRVLVEQTRDCAVTWLNNLGLLGGVAKFEDNGNRKRLISYEPCSGDDDPDMIRVHLLMGGEVDQDWDMYPERDAILIGTQDMLLSRALNRGYALSRFRWPVQFGLLNNDCLWVMDEIQLMGNGLATTTQLQAFRRLFNTQLPTRSLWMSATMHEDWLKTVDFDAELDAQNKQKPLDDDHNNQVFMDRYRARKKVIKADFEINDDGKQAALCAQKYHESGTRTLLVVNTVKRAQAIYRELQKLKTKKQDGLKAEIVLLHSRFRPHDRNDNLYRLLAQPNEQGCIAVCTQVIEAGVDISAKTLITELAPWSSLVQRFGRCNRYGEYDEEDRATIIWIPYADLDDKKLKPDPYTADELRTAAARLKDLTDAGPQNLPAAHDTLPFTHVLRRKDLIELFDTTPDLAGADIDVSRFIREADEYDVQVFWRDIPETGPSPDEKGPTRDELCSVPISKELKDKKNFWRWDHLEKCWLKINAGALYPGLVIMLGTSQGGYSQDVGWTGKEKVTPPVSHAFAPELESNDTDPQTYTNTWQTIAEHTDLVMQNLTELLRSMDGYSAILHEQVRAALIEAARWHDAGKAHEQFQRAIPEDAPEKALWGKSALKMKPYDRKGFRHELASALAMLSQGLPDLSVYLAAAHHGRVRLSIRSLPHETRPPHISQRFARGIWEEDILPETDLGGGIKSPKKSLTLSYMELGDDPQTGPSWLARMLKLRDSLGPFRLAFLETLLRIADWRASAYIPQAEQEGDK